MPVPPISALQPPRTPRLHVNHHHHSNDSLRSPMTPRGDSLRSPMTSPRSPMSMSNKLNIDPRNIDCVQLCMDIPFLDHPYLIGPRGRKSQYFMTRYKSLLHFPDTNCRADGLKLNNVLISGAMKNVEEIRSQLRLRTPIRVVVQLNQFLKTKQLVHQIEEAISQRSLPIRLNVADDLKTCVLKTEWRNEDLLVDFAEEFLNAKQLKTSGRTEELVSMGIALLPLVNPWNHELSHRLLGSFFEQTGCRIFYPPQEKYSVLPPTYFIKGPSMAGVLKACKYLMGLTMLQVTFYMPPGAVPTVKQNQLDDWQRDLLVHTTIYNPEPHQPVAQFKIVLRSFEFAINGLYVVRSALLGFKKSMHTGVYDFMRATKYLIPYTVFMDAKLFYPLYSVDGKNLHWPSRDFFDHFYGGPYSNVTGGFGGEHMSAPPHHPPPHHLPPHHPLPQLMPPPPRQQQHQLAVTNQPRGGDEASELEQQQPPNGQGFRTPPNNNQNAQKHPAERHHQPQQQHYTPDDFHVIHLSQLVESPPQAIDGTGMMTPHYIYFHAAGNCHQQNQQQNDSLGGTPQSSSYSTPSPAHNHYPLGAMSPADPLSLLQW